MWCKHCGQDVPGVARDQQGQFSCPRCSAAMRADSSSAHLIGLAESADHGLDLLTATSGVGAPTAELDDWQLAEDLRQLRRMLHSPVEVSGVSRTGTGPIASGHSSALNPPALQFVETSNSLRHPGSRGGSAVRSKRRRSVVAVMVSWLGLAACACGVGLLGWSLVENRSDLWNLGMPIALGGQFGLLCGLIMQLDRIWHDNSQTVEKLGHVDQRLSELKQTTLLNSPNHSAAGAFYSHLAQGASPQLLLADLKGQLDLLAVRLSTGG